MPEVSRFKVKKLLTRPLLKFSEDESRFVKIETAVYIGKDMKEAVKPGEKKREPAHIADVIDLETGAEAQIIVSAVVLSVLNETYPGDTYIGKSFSITKLSRQPGKSYFPYSVAEIEDPAADASVNVPAAAPATGLETTIGKNAGKK